MSTIKFQYPSEQLRREIGMYQLGSDHWAVGDSWGRCVHFPGGIGLKRTVSSEGACREFCRYCLSLSHSGGLSYTVDRAWVNSYTIPSGHLTPLLLGVLFDKTGLWIWDCSSFLSTSMCTIYVEYFIVKSGCVWWARPLLITNLANRP